MAGSLRARKFGQHYYLVAKMSDNTERIISMNGGVFPLGVANDEKDFAAAFEFDPSPLESGTTKEPDKALLPTLEDASEINPSELKALSAEFQFTYYEWFEEDQAATWSTSIFAEGVNIAGKDNLLAANEETPLVITIEA